MQASRARFLQIYGLLSDPDTLVRQKANRDLLQFQDDPSQDMWGLSKLLLGSTQILQQILGSQLLSCRYLQSVPKLNPQERSELAQYIILRIPNISHKGVRSKLAQSLAKLLFDRGEVQRWVGYLRGLVGFMDGNQQNLLFGLEVISNLLEGDSHLTAEFKEQKEGHLKEVIISAMNVESKNVKEEASKTLLVWVRNGLPILEDHRLLQLVMQSTSTLDLDYSSDILESAVSCLYSNNKSFPLQASQVSPQVKTSIEWIVEYVLQLARVLYIQQSCHIVVELSTSVLSKVSWIYDQAGNQIINHMLLILQHQDRSISSQAIVYFIQLPTLKLPVAILVSSLNKAVEIVLSKCLLVAALNDQFSDYRYHCHQFLQTVYSTYLSLELQSECFRLLQSSILDFLRSHDDNLKQLGIFCLLSVQEDLRGSPGMEWFNKQAILFCCVQSSFDPLERNCLKLLSKSCIQIIQLGLLQRVVESCLLRLLVETSQKANYSMNVLCVLFESLEVVEQDSKVASSLFEFYSNRSNLKYHFVRKFIEMLVEFCHKLPSPSRSILVILANEMELATDSMENLAVVLKTISTQNKRCQEYNSLLMQIKQSVCLVLTGSPKDYNVQSCFGVYRLLIDILGQSLDTIDIQIVQTAIGRAVTDHKQQNMLLYLDQALSFCNLTKSPVFHNWVQCNCYAVNDTLLGMLTGTTSQKLAEYFYKIQCRFVSNDSELYAKYPSLMQVLSVSSRLLASATVQSVRRAIISFYVEYSQQSLDSPLILGLLASAFSCIHNLTSTNYLLYFKLTSIVSKKADRELLQTTLHQITDQCIQYRFTSETKRLLVDLLIGTSVKEKANQFKSLLVELMRLQRREQSLEQFAQILSRQAKRIGL